MVKKKTEEGVIIIYIVFYLVILQLSFALLIPIAK